MPRTTLRKINLGSYEKCSICDYELKNNKNGMKLHFKYSHPGEDWETEIKDRLVCEICKKPNCKLH